MRPDSFDDRLDRHLTDRQRDSQFRHRRVGRPLDAVHVEIDGATYVNFASNNYLGLTHHPRVVQAVQHAAETFGVGAAASPLITGYTTAHASAEAALAKWKGTEAAVLLPSGYQANQAAIETIRRAGEKGRHSGTRFLVDKLAHASLIDAVMSVGCFRIFNHNDLEKLERLLADAADDANVPHEPHIDVVVTESIFSMDGDAAPLRELAALKKKYPFFLLLDEAHGSGVYGEHGAGYAAEIGVPDIVDACVVTLSKALGCAGAAICASKKFCDAVVNFGRAYIYSTAVPPTTAAACEAAIGVMRDEPWRQQRVRALARRVRATLNPARNPPLNLAPSDSPIIPVVLGSENAAIAAAETFRGAGLLVLPIRPPTVPRGTSRLRITLSCEHADAEIDQLVAALLKLLAIR